MNIEFFAVLTVFVLMVFLVAKYFSVQIKDSFTHLENTTSKTVESLRESNAAFLEQIDESTREVHENNIVRHKDLGDSIKELAKLLEGRIAKTHEYVDANSMRITEDVNEELEKLHKTLEEYMDKQDEKYEKLRDKVYDSNENFLKFKSDIKEEVMKNTNRIEPRSTLC